MFVSFEGTEGCGKSTQAQALVEHLEGRGLAVVFAREPGGTALGEHLRGLLLDGFGGPLGTRAETLLFAAARAQLVEEVLLPALRAGTVGVVDRYLDSTVAYQSFGRGLERTAVQSVLAFATAGLRPDLTVLLDLDPREGLARKGVATVDRFERLPLEFHERVRAGYLALAAEEPERWLVLDGRRPAADLAALVRARAEALLGGPEGAGTDG